MAPLNLGTDGGGSIRIPAAFSGIVGLKPQYGVVPFAPVSPYGTLSHVGPMCRSVEDCALMLQVIGRPDVRDWLAPKAADQDYLATINKGIKVYLFFVLQVKIIMELQTKGLRIGYARTINNAAVDPEVAAHVDKAVSVLRDLGAEVVEVVLNMDRVTEVFQDHWSVGCATTLKHNYTEEQQKLMDHTLTKTAALGNKVPLLQVRYSFYFSLQNFRPPVHKVCHRSRKARLGHARVPLQVRRRRPSHDAVGRVRCWKGAARS